MARHCNWVELFYCNTESCILNNGWASNFFDLSRGVRQGCPLSPYLFILSVEILAEAIRNKKEIKGIKIHNTEVKVSQYADDTTLILDGTEESVRASLLLIEAFGNISGLRLNNESNLSRIFHCLSCRFGKAVLNLILSNLVDSDVASHMQLITLGLNSPDVKFDF